MERQSEPMTKKRQNKVVISGAFGLVAKATADESATAELVSLLQQGLQDARCSAWLCPMSPCVASRCPGGAASCCFGEKFFSNGHAARLRPRPALTLSIHPKPPRLT
jgi:hypothetical protein